MSVSRRTFIKGAALATIACSTLPFLSGCTSSASHDTTEIEAVKIGGIGPMTGPDSVFGTAAHFGAQVAVDEINATGRRKFQLNWQDSNSDITDATAAYNRLKDWGAQFIVGPLLSSTCEAVSYRTFYDSILQITPSASSVVVLGAPTIDDSVTQNNRRQNVFQMCVDDQTLGHFCAQVLKKHFSNKRIGVLYNKSNQYSTGLAKHFLHEAREISLSIYALDSVTMDKKQGAIDQLKSMQADKVDIIFIPLYSSEIAKLLKDAAQIDFKPQWLGADGVDSLLSMNGFDQKLAEDILYVSSFYERNTPRAELFTRKYIEAVDGLRPTQISANTYDTVYLINQLLDSIGTGQKEDSSSQFKKFIDTMQNSNFKFTGIAGKNVTWNEYGVCNKETRLMVIKNGKSENYE